MPLTLKNFIAFAAALKAQKPNPVWIKTAEDRIAYLCAEAQWTLDCRAIADVCAASNLKFNRARFLTACGITETP